MFATSKLQLNNLLCCISFKIHP